MSEHPPTEGIAPKITVLNGFAFPSSGFSDTEGLPLVRIRDLESSTTETRFRGKFDPRYLLKDGDVLIGMDGDFNVVHWRGGEALLNQRVCKVEARPGAIDSGFLYYSLQPKIVEIHRRTPQTTVRHLSTRAVMQIELPMFSLAEQRRIAEILATVDDAIRSTESLIAKLESVKWGLLADLMKNFRGGADAFDQVLAETFAGAWGADPLGDGTDIRVLRSTEICDDGGLVLETGVPRQLSSAERSRRLLRSGDILLEASGGAPGRPVGRSAMYVATSGKEAFAASNFIRVLRHGQRLHPGFFSWYLLWLYRTPAILRYQQQTTGISNLKYREFLQERIDLPPIPEQHRTCDILDAGQVAIAGHRGEAAKLRHLKDGLIADLLTGRVRVKLGEDTA